MAEPNRLLLSAHPWALSHVDHKRVLTRQIVDRRDFGYILFLRVLMEVLALALCLLDQCLLRPAKR